MLNYYNSITRIKFLVKPTGKYIVTLITRNGRGITRLSRVYFARLQAAGFLKTIKMILTK